MPLRQSQPGSGWPGLNHAQAIQATADDLYMDNEDIAMDEEAYEDDHEEDAEQSHHDAPSVPRVRDLERALHPLQATADRVGKQVELFAESLDRLSRDKKANSHLSAVDCRRAVPFVKAYKDISTDTVQHLRTIHTSERQSEWARSSHRSKNGRTNARTRNANRKEMELLTSVTDLRRWELEEQTWDLVGRFIQLEYPSLDKERAKDVDFGAPRPRAPKHLHKFSSETDVWSHFLSQDDQAWEQKTVVDWLHAVAEATAPSVEESIASLEAEADRSSGIVAHSWLYTREAIKAQKRLRSWARAFEPNDPGLDTSLKSTTSQHSLVTQLDPDAVTRQGRSLEKQDGFFERAMWLACWELLRRGQTWQEVQDWCNERLENWRAVVLHGDADVSRGRSESGGWFSRFLWRKACAVAAQEGSTNEYENAVYGFLGGQASAVLPVCTSWHDHLLAWYKAYLLHAYNNCIRKDLFSQSYTSWASSNDLVNMSSMAGQKSLPGDQAIQHLKRTENVHEELRMPLNALQASIIGRTFGPFATKYGIGLARDSHSSRSSIDHHKTSWAMVDFDFQDYDFLRLMTHIVLLHRDLSRENGTETDLMATENIIAAYVDFLGKAGKRQLLPLYASQMSLERSSQCMAKQLPMVIQSDERTTIMNLMRDYGMDVSRVLFTQIQLNLIDVSAKNPSSTSRIPPLSILGHPTAEGGIRSIKTGFLEQSLTDEQMDLVHAFEWYLLFDGFWQQTMITGVSLYKFFLQIRAYAAGRFLSQNDPFSQISLQKTYPILGVSIDISSLDRNGAAYEQAHNGVVTSPRKSKHRHKTSHSSHRSRTLKGTEVVTDIDHLKVGVLLEQAKPFRHFQQLFTALDDIKEWRNLASQITSVKQSASSVELRRLSTPFKSAYGRVQKSMSPLLRDDWLHPSLAQDSTEAAEFRQIRQGCLPEVFLAYNSILNFSSYYAGREVLKTSMDLAALLAADRNAVATSVKEGGSITETLIYAGRMTELMDSFAVCAKSMIVADSKRPGKKAKDGRSLSIWTAQAENDKPESDEVNDVEAV